jgi:hypothetical protein
VAGMKRFIRKLITDQTAFLSLLTGEMRFAFFLLLVLQFSFGLYHLLQVPLHYDEWYSYHFSGNSFRTVCSFYPTNNNHIFFNLSSRLFIITGLDREIALRLPSLIASVVCSYYFFKICVFLFRPLLGLLLLGLFVSTYWVVLYTFMGRGYGFQNLFTVLCMHSTLQLVADYKQNWYRGLFVISAILGMYTLPSFFYTLTGIYPVLFCYVLLQKSSRNFGLLFLDMIICVGVVLLLYLPVILNNDLKTLLEPIGSSEKLSFNDPEALEKIVNYLNLLFAELFRWKHLGVCSILILLAIIYRSYSSGFRASCKFLLPVFIFFSPLIIISIHRLFPFGRNWLYLTGPSILCLGIAVDSGFDVAGRMVKLRLSVGFRRLVIFLLILMPLYYFVDFGRRHRSTTVWDYDVDFFRKKILGNRINHVRSMASTQAGFEFYPADELMMILRKETGDENIRVETLDQAAASDLLIVNESEKEKYRNKLRAYHLVYMHDHTWFYLRNGFE